jgi:hypothetical protein
MQDFNRDFPDDQLAKWCIQWCWAAGHISAGMGRFADVAVCL